MNEVVIVSGGLGTRMKSKIPKQYLKINGKPVLVWTIEKFLEFDPHISIVLVLGPNHQDYWSDIVNVFPVYKNIVVAKGGKNRFYSVKNGLEMIDTSSIVGIHDAVRPLVSVQTIQRCYDSAREYNSGIPYIMIEDTIRIVEHSNNTQLERENLRRIQTPQVFAGSHIKNAYQQQYKSIFTDDAAVYESAYHSIRLVEGNPENIKITRPIDLKLASLILD